MILIKDITSTRYVSKNYALEGYLDGDEIFLNNGFSFIQLIINTNPCKVLLFGSVHCPTLDAKLLELMPELNNELGRELDISPIISKIDEIFDRMENEFLPTAAKYFA